MRYICLHIQFFIVRFFQAYIVYQKHIRDNRVSKPMTKLRILNDAAICYSSLIKYIVVVN